MPLGADYKNNVLDAILGAGFTADATVYVALFTTPPDSDGAGGVEVSGGSYGRESVTNNATNFPAASSGVKSNGVAITFTTATADWGDITHFAVMNHETDAADATNIIAWGALTTTKSIDNGDTASFPIGTLIISEVSG